MGGRQADSCKPGKAGEERHKYERRIFPLGRQRAFSPGLEEPNRLIIEMCIATSARISEVLGLQWKHVDLDAGTIKIEQRVCTRISIGRRPRTAGGYSELAIW